MEEHLLQVVKFTSKLLFSLSSKNLIFVVRGPLTDDKKISRTVELRHFSLNCC